jgi:hypothetical protein
MSHDLLPLDVSLIPQLIARGLMWEKIRSCDVAGVQQVSHDFLGLQIRYYGRALKYR